MTNVVAITGIGTLTPAGRGVEALWKAVSSEDTYIKPIDPQKYFDPTSYACGVAGQVPFFSDTHLTETIIAQTDRCSQLAFVAVLDALKMAQLPMDFRSENSPVSANRVALAISTIAAGWTYTEREMQNLWTRGVGAMNRYGLTAGFPAGPQGHISIPFGVEGRTRTFVSERASGAQALIEGAKAIQNGEAEIVLAGGTDAPITPIVWSAYDPMLQPTNRLEHRQTGMLIGEGSTFLLLEEREHARSRGVPILAEVHGWGKRTDPNPLEGSLGREMKLAIHASLKKAGIQPYDVDAIFPGGPALAAEDAAEYAAIQDTFEQTLPLVLPKSTLGHLLGAATATDVAIATLALNHQELPLIDFAHSDLPIDYALILSTALGGMYASLVLGKSA
jgi:3-oxoacyl-(acyl-carrier-protein) synthase